MYLLVKKLTKSVFNFFTALTNFIKLGSKIALSRYLQNGFNRIFLKTGVKTLYDIMNSIIIIINRLPNYNIIRTYKYDIISVLK